MVDRIPYITREASSARINEIFDKHPHDIALWRIIAHAQATFEPWMQLNGSIMNNGSPRESDIQPTSLRELAVIQTCLLCDSPYEWVAHARNAMHLFKLPLEQIDAVVIERNIESDVLDKDQKLVLRFATEIVEKVRASEATMTAMQERFTQRQIVELTFAIGAYMMNCRLAELGRLDVMADADFNELFKRNPYLEHMRRLGHEPERRLP
ncbi:MAG: carboxymuconolactone decarboxylase family protein [Pseudomonadota bacterium]